MRACLKQLLFPLAFAVILGFCCHTQAQSLKTNSIALGKAGTLHIASPTDWTWKYIGVNQPDHEPMFDFYAPSNSLTIRLYIRWDGFAGKSSHPAEAEMTAIVSNNITTQYLPQAVEKTFDLEKLHGPAVAGIYARLTDKKWTPMVKDNYPYICEGMFRAGNIWGNFNLLTYDKDGNGFKAGMKVLESLRREP